MNRPIFVEGEQVNEQRLCNLQVWCVFQNELPHTKRLTKKEAEKLASKHKKHFPHINFYVDIDRSLVSW